MTGHAPTQTDADSRPFWDYARAHELRCQRCASCGRLRFPAAPLCPVCRSEDAEWERLSGRGTVRSWTTTHRVAHPAFAGSVPYTSVLVELAEQPGLLLYGLLAGGGAAAEGLPVQAEFDDLDGATIVLWGPAAP